MIKWILLVISVVLLSLMAFLVLGDRANEFMDIIVKDGFLPRAISWICLLLGVYGMARRRFSPTMMLMLFSVALFFTYIGPFIFKELY